MSGGHRLCADRSGAKTGGIPMAGKVLEQLHDRSEKEAPDDRKDGGE